ncbi:MAG: hypothetical protein WEE64_03800 [Dehalococcoidia bacterium]
MATDQLPVLDVDRALVGELNLGTFDVPFVDLGDVPSVYSHLRMNGTEYGYERSFPVQGHSAVMPGAVAELLAAGRKVLVAERNERFLVYLA